jgi:hypothetical protein
MYVVEIQRPERSTTACRPPAREAYVEGSPNELPSRARSEIVLD